MLVTTRNWHLSNQKKVIYHNKIDIKNTKSNKSMTKAFPTDI